MSLGRLLATVARLKPVQVIDRAARPLRSAWAARAPDGEARLRTAPPVRPLPIARERMQGDRFEVAGVTRSVVGVRRWARPEVPRLWSYRLHGFRWLHDVERSAAQAWVLAWMDENPCGARPGWEPYCLSLRVREWLEWLLGDRGAAGEARILRSLVQQVEALRRQLELHLLGNHLLENAVTLCWAGLRLDAGPSSDWLRLGIPLLRRSLREQILADGVHAERSPMYQAAVAETLLRLEAVAGSSTVPAARRVQALAGTAGRRLLGTLGSFVHPDGEYARVNDTAEGFAPTRDALERRFGRSEPPAAAHVATVHPRGGFATWRGDAGQYLLWDAGGIGPRHQPGHGHAGALSFELSHRGERLVTDTGVGGYDVDDARRHDRSTAAHSTVEIDGRNQSDVWAAFRCGERVRPLPVRSHATDRGVRLRGGYVGSTHAHRGVRHRRTLDLDAGAVRVRDEIRCLGTHEAVSRLHLAPGITVRPVGERLDLLRDGRTVARLVGPRAWEVGESVHHPTFWISIPRVCLTLRTSFEREMDQRWTLQLR